MESVLASLVTYCAQYLWSWIESTTDYTFIYYIIIHLQLVSGTLHGARS